MLGNLFETSGPGGDSISAYLEEADDGFCWGHDGGGGGSGGVDRRRDVFLVEPLLHAPRHQQSASPPGRAHRKQILEILEQCLPPVRNYAVAMAAEKLLGRQAEGGDVEKALETLVEHVEVLVPPADFPNNVLMPTLEDVDSVAVVRTAVGAEDKEREMFEVDNPEKNVRKKHHGRDRSDIAAGGQRRRRRRSC